MWDKNFRISNKFPVIASESAFVGKIIWDTVRYESTWSLDYLVLYLPESRIVLLDLFYDVDLRSDLVFVRASQYNKVS